MPLTRTSENTYNSPDAITSQRKRKQQLCRYGNACKNPSLCQYQHPELCRFDKNCYNKKCKFTHTIPPKIPLPIITEEEAEGGSKPRKKKKKNTTQKKNKKPKKTRKTNKRK